MISDDVNCYRSPSLRGRHHSKVPDISNQPLDTLLPETKDDQPHCRPYYLTKFVQLSLADTDFPPWNAVSKQVGCCVGEINDVK